MESTGTQTTEQRSEEAQRTDSGADEKKRRRAFYRSPGDLELAEKVRDVKTIWPAVDEETKTHINRSILARLRVMDYVARQKLMMLQTGLHIEQADDRPEFEEFQDLHELVPLIEDIEQTIAQEDFDQELTTAVFSLSRDGQEQLLKKLAAEQVEPDADAANNQPEPEAVHDVSPDAEVENGKLCRSEKILKKWLLDQSVKTKLASLILSTLRFDDHGTNKLANEIYEKYEDEIMAIAANPPEDLTRDELVMTGIVAEQSLWFQHY